MMRWGVMEGFLEEGGPVTQLQQRHDAPRPNRKGAQGAEAGFSGRIEVAARAWRRSSE